MRVADILLQNDFTSLSQEQLMDGLCQTAFAEGLPLALWRMPGRDEKHLLIDLSGEASPVHPEVEALPPGFLFTPYQADLTAPNARQEKQSLLLNAHIHYSTAGEGQLRLAEGLSASMEELAAKILKEAGERGEGREKQDRPPPYYVQEVRPIGDTGKEAYIRMVEAAVKEIQEGRLQKLVCARTKVVALPEGFHSLQYFLQLCNAYPNAFVSFVSVPGLGSWIGATPEVLISIKEGKIFRTMALAGTQPKAAVSKPSEAVWRQKEIEEQALVSRYVINCFKKIRLRDFDEVGPRTVVAGNLMHLRTDFTVDMESTNFPQLGSIMLELLHPTSAVCGMPRAQAKAFLDEHEQLDRQFFAGFLGPVNMLDESCLFVNLRCLELLGKNAILYAGAGITADSDPEKEWQETEEKIRTLTAFLA